jgi:hypothetical protein
MTLHTKLRRGDFWATRTTPRDRHFKHTLQDSLMQARLPGIIACDACIAPFHTCENGR